MKERPILFSSPMVRAILAGTKTQTRRVVKALPDRDFGPRCALQPHEIAGEINAGRFRISRYGAPGDRLWVRETWREWSDAAWHYAADGTVMPKLRDRDLSAFLAQRSPFTWESYSWRPSIHMPRSASRITLEITGVRVERLQGISEADAIAEGVEAIPPTGEGAGPNLFTVDVGGMFFNSPTATGAYAMLWEHINGPGSWDANPWVWVVCFKRVSEGV